MRLILFVICFSVMSCGINRWDKNGRRTGKWIHYFDDEETQVSSIGKYRNGCERKMWVHYQPDGSLLKTEYFGKENIETNIYHENGELRKHGFAKWDSTKASIHYYWVGEWEEYSEIGELVGKEFYSNGIISKKEHYYAGQRVSTGLYKDGKLNEVIND